MEFPITNTFWQGQVAICSWDNHYLLTGFLQEQY